MLLGMGVALTKDQCAAYQCGADPTNMAARFACAQAGYSGVKTCLDPDCAPFCSAPAGNTDSNAPVSMVPQLPVTNPPAYVAPVCATSSSAAATSGGGAAGFGLADVVAQLKTIPCWAWVAGGLAVVAWRRF